MTIIRQIDENTAVLAGIGWAVADQSMGRAEARARAKSADANAFQLRGDERNLASAQLPGKAVEWRNKRLITLAGSIADAAPVDSWCGVFEFEGRYVFLAATARRILPDADVAFSSADEARARLETERPIFDATYAPDSWAMADAQSASELMNGIDWTNVPTMQFIGGGSSTSPRVILLMVTGAVVIAFAGWQYWQNVKAEREAAELAARQAAQQPVESWTSLPKPDRATQACFAARGVAADMSHQGWVLEKLECDLKGGQFKATLIPFTTGNVMPPRDSGMTIKLKGDGSGLEVSGPLVLPAGPARQDEKGSLDIALAARNLVVSYAQSAGWQAQADRNTFNFQIAANLAPLAAKFSALPTLSFTRMEFAGDQWRVEAEVFN